MNRIQSRSTLAVVLACLTASSFAVANGGRGGQGANQGNFKGGGAVRAPSNGGSRAPGGVTVRPTRPPGGVTVTPTRPPGGVTVTPTRPPSSRPPVANPPRPGGVRPPTPVVGIVRPPTGGTKPPVVVGIVRPPTGGGKPPVVVGIVRPPTGGVKPPVVGIVRPPAGGGKPPVVVGIVRPPQGGGKPPVIVGIVKPPVHPPGKPPVVVGIVKPPMHPPGKPPHWPPHHPPHRPRPHWPRPRPNCPPVVIIPNWVTPPVQYYPLATPVMPLPVAAVQAEAYNLSCRLPDNASPQDLLGVDAVLERSGDRFIVRGTLYGSDNSKLSVSTNGVGMMDDRLNLSLDQGDQIYLEAVADPDLQGYLQGTIELLGRSDKKGLLCTLTPYRD